LAPTLWSKGGTLGGEYYFKKDPVCHTAEIVKKKKTQKRETATCEENISSLDRREAYSTLGNTLQNEPWSPLSGTV